MYVGDTGRDICATYAYYSCSRFHIKFVLRIRDARAVLGRMDPKWNTVNSLGVCFVVCSFNPYT
jgi:hypothetical protein